MNIRATPTLRTLLCTSVNKAAGAAPRMYRVVDFALQSTPHSSLDLMSKSMCRWCSKTMRSQSRCGCQRAQLGVPQWTTASSLGFHSARCRLMKRGIYKCFCHTSPPTALRCQCHQIRPTTFLWPCRAAKPGNSARPRNLTVENRPAERLNHRVMLCAVAEIVRTRSGFFVRINATRSI